MFFLKKADVPRFNASKPGKAFKNEQLGMFDVP